MASEKGELAAVLFKSLSSRASLVVDMDATFLMRRSTSSMETPTGGGCWTVISSPDPLPAWGALCDGDIRAGDLLVGGLRDVDLRGGDPPAANWLEYLAAAAYGSMRGLCSCLW